MLHALYYHCHSDVLRPAEERRILSAPGNDCRTGTVRCRLLTGDPKPIPSATGIDGSPSEDDIALFGIR